MPCIVHSPAHLAWHLSRAQVWLNPSLPHTATLSVHIVLAPESLPERSTNDWCIHARRCTHAGTGQAAGGDQEQQVCNPPHYRWVRGCGTGGASSKHMMHCFHAGLLLRGLAKTVCGEPKSPHLRIQPTLSGAPATLPFLLRLHPALMMQPPHSSLLILALAHPRGCSRPAPACAPCAGPDGTTTTRSFFDDGVAGQRRQGTALPR